MMNIPYSRKTLSAAVISASLGFTPVYVVAQNVLEEVIVTANRRDQSVTDIPYNISALTGDDMDAAGINTASDLFRAMPGVSYVEQGPRSGVKNSTLIMRAINSEAMARNSGPLATAPVVSTYIDETPVFVNLRFTDLERVEVLRGPQGTLYGSGSLGGSVRYIYNKPDFEAFSGEVSGGLSQTENGDGINYETDLMLNVPITDTLAMRINGGYVDTAGFIDQPNLYVLNPDGSPALDNGSTDPFGDSANFFAGQPVYRSKDGVNNGDTTSARIAFSWVPTDALDVNLSYHYQTDNVDGTQMNSYAMYGDDSFKNDSVIEEPFERDVDILALDVGFDMGFASFSASASTYESEGNGSRDLTGFYVNGLDFYESVYGTSPRPLVEDISRFDDQGDVFEARLVSQGDNTLDWVVGAFYMEQDIKLSANQYFRGYDDYANACFIETDFQFGGAPCGFGTLFGIEETNGPITIVKDEAYLTDQKNTFEDLAFFGELTWNITDRWQVTGGARYYDQEFKTRQIGGLVFVPDGVESRSKKSTDSDTLFKYNTSYAVTDNLNIYALWSEGYRRGGANGLPNQGLFGDPVNEKAFVYNSDTTENIEVGIKGVLFDSFRYTLAYYDIDWDDTQANLSCTDLALLCVVNAGDATSKGIEADLQGQLTENLEINISYTYNDSELKSLSSDVQEFLDDGTLFSGVETGSALPGASDHTAYMGATYRQMLSNGMEVLYGVNGSYRSEAESTLETTSVELDSFWLFNALVTLQADAWSVRAFINNIDDERGLLGADPVENWGPGANAQVSMPRTYGLSASYSF